MKSSLCYLLIGCGLIACSGNSGRQYPRYAAFPDEQTLSSEVIPLDTALFRYPFRVAVRDGVLLVSDLHNADYYLHAFTWPDAKHLVSFGRRGEGPEEMLMAETFQFNSPDSIWVLDSNRAQITRWRISVNGRTAERVEEVNLDKSLVRTLDFHETETGFIVPDYSGEYRFHLTDRQGKRIRSVGRIPTVQTAKDGFNPALAQAWRSFIDYSPGNGVLAMATQLGEVLEIHHLTDSTPVVLYGPAGEPVFQTHQGEGIPTGIMGFSDIQVTERFIYALFQGTSFKAIQTAYEKGRKLESGGRLIYVFDLNGRPVHKYMLDRAISGMYVDEAAGMIVAVDVNSDEPVVKIKL
jgi:hypothetical protein